MSDDDVEMMIGDILAQPVTLCIDCGAWKHCLMKFDGEGDLITGCNGDHTFLVTVADRAAVPPK
jgi:hypothetical protein